MLTHGIPPEFRGGVHIFLPAPPTIGSFPSLSGHAIAYRLRSLPRVRWHRASSPQGSSSNGCCLCITMGQMLLCSSLFPHPLLIYSENVQIIGLYKVYKYQNISTTAVFYCCTVCGTVFCFLPPTYSVCVCVCVFSSHSFWTSSSLDVPAAVTQEKGHTGFLIHLLSAVHALMFLARRIQPFFSLVDRDVEFCVLTI